MPAACDQTICAAPTSATRDHWCSTDCARPPPRQNTLGTFSRPGGAPTLGTPERPSSAIPGSLARNKPIFRDLTGTFGAKGGAEMAGFITQ